MKYTVALYYKEVEHYFEDVNHIQLENEDYIVWGKDDKILAIYPRKEVRYIQVTND